MIPLPSACGGNYHPLMGGQLRRKQHMAVAAAAITIGATAAVSGVAEATPFCFDTGPGYQKCVNSGHDLTPTYQGPKIFDSGTAPWAPTPVYLPPPVYFPPVPSGNVSSEDYVSLATPPGSPTVATFGVAGNQADADAIALAQCATTGQPCQVVAQAFHACTAFAVGAGGMIANGVGPDIVSARDRAMNATSGGAVVGAYCATPPGRN